MLNSRLTSPLESPLRFCITAACLTTAGVHLMVLEDHLREAPYIGILFLCLSLVTASSGVLLTWRDSRGLYVLVSTASLLAIAAFVWSRAIGLPQIGDDVGNWTEPLGIVAVASEVLAVLLSAAAVARLPSLANASRVPARAAGSVMLGLGIASVSLGTLSNQAAASHPGMPMIMSRMNMSGGSYWKSVKGGPLARTGVTRHYYISADMAVWNYAPQHRNMISGRPFGALADIYVKSGIGRIGPRYLKCIYRGYTDATFRHLLPRPANQQYLGLLGPVIRAEVGDRIRVVFRNTCPFPASIHPHGVFYKKDSEGAPYNDGTKGGNKSDDAVPTGKRHTYTWLVPQRAGPAQGDGSSVMWMYHSHTHEISDTYAGLMGPIEITARGMARKDGSPKDVNREIFTLFSVMNENNSPFLRRNLKRFAQKPYPRLDDEEFNESNLMHSINGYVFGNEPMITMHKGDHVRWYVMSMGTEVDLHTPHWHGNTVVVNGMRMDTINLLPATMTVADMVPDDEGIWLFHCHVNDHIRAGMLTRYQVLPPRA